MKQYGLPRYESNVRYEVLIYHFESIEYVSRSILPNSFIISYMQSLEIDL